MTTNRVRLFALAACTSAALVAAACGGSSSPAAPSGSTGGGSGSTAVTFSTLQTQIFSVSCTSCHTDAGRTPAGGLNLTPGSSYGALVNVASSEKAGAVRVIPGDPENSYLVQKLRGDAGIVGLRMPRSGPPFLTDDQVNLVKQWIQQGAPNN
jgi:hypothetical protein